MPPRLSRTTRRVGFARWQGSSPQPVATSRPRSSPKSSFTAPEWADSLPGMLSEPAVPPVLASTQGRGAILLRQHRVEVVAAAGVIVAIVVPSSDEAATCWSRSPRWSSKSAPPEASHPLNRCCATGMPTSRPAAAPCSPVPLHWTPTSAADWTPPGDRPSDYAIADRRVDGRVLRRARHRLPRAGTDCSLHRQGS
jgi:hypothetical protein